MKKLIVDGNEFRSWFENSEIKEYDLYGEIYEIYSDGSVYVKDSDGSEIVFEPSEDSKLIDIVIKDSRSIIVLSFLTHS